MSVHTLNATAENNRQRLDLFLVQSLKDLPSRTYAQKLIDDGRVMVNGNKVTASYKLNAEDKIVVDAKLEETIDDRIKPEDIPLDIFYEDDQLVVINKPSGMIVHPAQGCYTGTLVNALLFHFQDLSDLNTAIRPGIVHRLDRETSGLIVIAKNNHTHALLAKQFKKHMITKRYVALVEGLVEFDEGIIDAPIARDNVHREKKRVRFDDEDAKDSVTRYKVIERYAKATLVALYPQTGRTHQLRVHMAHLKHPILGDEKYGKKTNFPRLALHAQAIGFLHPKTKQWIEFSTLLPVEFKEIRSFT